MGGHHPEGQGSAPPGVVCTWVSVPKKSEKYVCFPKSELLAKMIKNMSKRITKGNQKLPKWMMPDLSKQMVIEIRNPFLTVSGKFWEHMFSPLLSGDVSLSFLLHQISEEHPHLPKVPLDVSGRPHGPLKAAK